VSVLLILPDIRARTEPTTYIQVHRNGDKYDPNDTFNSATQVANTPLSQANLIIDDDDDFYRLTIDTESSLQASIGFAHDSGDLDLYLYDGRERLLASSTSRSDNETINVDDEEA